MIRISKIIFLALFFIFLSFEFSHSFDIKFRSSDDFNLDSQVKNENLKEVNPLVSGYFLGSALNFVFTYLNNIITFILFILFNIFYTINTSYLFYIILFILFFLFFKFITQKEHYLNQDYESLIQNLEDEKEEIKTNPYSKEIELIFESLKSNNSDTWDLAILKANHLLGKILEENNFLGETVAEKAKSITNQNLAQKILSVNRIRNKIAHNEDSFKLSESEFRKVMQHYGEIYQYFLN